MSTDPQAHGGDPGSDRDGRRERLKRMFGAEDGQGAERVAPPADGEGWRDEPAPGGNGAAVATQAGTQTATRSWQQPDPGTVGDGSAWSTGSWVRRPPQGALPEPPSPAGPGREPLVGSPDELRGSWQQVQAVFVDDPHRAVHEAGVLVGRTLEDIRARLTDGLPSPSGASSTEDLRVALLRYREVLHRLLSA